MRMYTYMVRPVSLSDPAFAALRKEKQKGESDSDVILRLVREARGGRRDPRHFVRSRRHRTRILSPDDHLEFVARMREEDRERDPWGRADADS